MKVQFPAAGTGSVLARVILYAIALALPLAEEMAKLESMRKSYANPLSGSR